MKKLSLIIAICICGLVAKANVKTPNVISNEILEGIKIEKQFINQNQKVEILFTTNLNGDVNFALAKTNNSNLKQPSSKFTESKNKNCKIDQKGSTELYQPEIK